MCGVNINIAGSQSMLRDAKEEWTAEAENKSSKQGSSYVRDISDIIVGFGMAYIQEYTSPHYAVDIALSALKVAIEVDGPTHRSRNTGQALGATAMKQRHVRAAGWRLMTVSHSEWDQLQGRQHKQDFLQSRLDALKL